jgi:lipopolysaccharide transport system ATP-binding protein
MRKHEIARKLDEIIDFSGCERYIDTPVKRYSSGMYVRLAFAVAAHLEPDILIVDEVLAVGDASFQRKCLGKMGDVAKQGRTILFVSHAMAAVQSLCNRGVLLAEGRLVVDDTVEEAIKEYTRGSSTGQATHDLSQVSSRRGTGEMQIVTFWMEDSAGKRTSTVLNGHACSFVFHCRTRDEGASLSGVAATVTVRSILGTRVFYHHNLLTGQDFDDVAGTVELRVLFPRLPLSEGTYIADLHLSRDRGRTEMDVVDGEVSFEVIDGDFYGTGFEYKGGLNAAVIVDGAWSCRPVSGE